MKKVEKFEPGDKVSWDFEVGTVVSDHDSTVWVQLPGGAKVKWYKMFGGQPVQLVQKAVA